MRTYRCDSPEAAGRLVALSLLADGHVSSDELKEMGDARLTERLGLAPGEFATIVQGLGEDLMLVAHLNWGDLCQPDSEVMQQLITELRDPQTQAEVMSLRRIAVEANRYIAQGEFDLLRALEKAWKVPPATDLTWRQCADPVGDSAR
jgi:hypothetical protein